MIHVGKDHVESLARLDSVCHDVAVFPYPVNRGPSAGHSTFASLSKRLNSPNVQTGFFQQPSGVRIMLHLLNVDRCSVCRKSGHLRSLHFRVTDNSTGGGLYA